VLRSRLMRLVGNGLLLLVGGCATMPPPVPPDPTPLSPPSTAVSPTAGLSGRPGGGRRELGGPDGVTRLCESLRDEDGLTFTGTDEQQQEARDDHERARLEAAEAVYSVRVPPGGFDFRTYNPEDKQLTLDTGRNFVVADGVELVAADPQIPLAFTLAPAAADAMVKGRAGLSLDLVFRPVRSDLRKDGCVRLSGGRVVKLPIEALAYTLLGGGARAVARGHSPDYVDDSPVVGPQVKVGKPRAEQGQAVSDAAVQALGPALLPCYTKALEKRPNLRGTLILDVRVGSDGRIESPRMQVSSLGDEALVACALSRANHAHLPGVGAARLSLPVSFGGKND
jgi:hypothetical protein